MARRSRGWSVERRRIGADQWEVRACYSWQTRLDFGAGPSAERPAEEQQALLARANAASRSAVSSLKRPREEAEAPVTLSAAEREKAARRIVARQLWLVARHTKTCLLDALLEEVAPRPRYSLKRTSCC